MIGAISSALITTGLVLVWLLVMFLVPVLVLNGAHRVLKAQYESDKKSPDRKPDSQTSVHRQDLLRHKKKANKIARQIIADMKANRQDWTYLSAGGYSTTMAFVNDKKAIAVSANGNGTSLAVTMNLDRDTSDIALKFDPTKDRTISISFPRRQSVKICKKMARIVDSRSRELDFFQDIISKRIKEKNERTGKHS